MPAVFPIERDCRYLQSILEPNSSFFISVDGNWGKWGNWTICSKTCGEGLKNRTRECNNPTPMFGGKSCDGNSTDVDRCKDRECPGKREDNTESYG